MLGFYLKRELGEITRRPVRWVSLAVFTGLALWALVGGMRWQMETERVLSETPADLLTDRSEWFEELDSVERGDDVSPYAARPMNLTSLALQKPGTLAALAYREEAIHPHSTMINGWRSEASLFRRYEVQGPSTLGAGALDLAFVVTVLLPLFLLILSFDVLSSERESGRLSLLLVQGGSTLQLILARIVAVSLPLLLVPMVCVVIAAVVNGGAVAAVVLWLAVIAVYTLFWAGIAAWIAAYFTNMVSGALAILAAWSLLVVFIPSGAQFAAQALYPVPSRVSYLSDARDAEGTARRNVEERAEIYMAEHPGQADASDDAVPGFYRTSYLANLEINQQTRPIVETLEARQAAQRRFVGVVGFLSPAILAKQVLHSASGTGATRAAEFRRQAREYLGTLLAQIGPATVGRQRLSSAEARTIPEFDFAPPSLSSAWIVSLIWMALAALLLAMLTRQRLNQPGSH